MRTWFDSLGRVVAFPGHLILIPDTEEPPPVEAGTLVSAAGGQSNVQFARIPDKATAEMMKVAAYLSGMANGGELGLSNLQDPDAYTTIGGTGLYAVSPVAFLVRNDSISPSTWVRGTAGVAFHAWAASLTSQQRADLGVVCWFHSESDTKQLTARSQKATYKTALVNWCGKMRESLGRTTASLPILMWSAIPYNGGDIGTQIHREVVSELAADPAANVVLALTQSADSMPRGAALAADGTWTGGDPAHRDATDNLRMWRRAGYALACAMRDRGETPGPTVPPLSTPRRGPSVAHAYRVSDSVIRVTVAHEAGSDLRLSPRAALGVGWTVMDGAARVAASSAVRVSATQIDLTLASPLVSPSSAAGVYYIYGMDQVGRLGAVTDNWSTTPQAVGIATLLGPDYAQDWPLQTTVLPVPLSDTP